MKKYHDLANEISAIRNKSLLPDESIWVDKIEKIRKQLNSCSEKIPVVDYGAGSGATWFFRSYRSDQASFPGTRYQRRQVRQVSRKASTPPGKALLYFKIIREMKPAVCLELGTGLGISAAYQAVALKLNQNVGRIDNPTNLQGKLYTLEGSPSLTSIARKNFEKLGLDNITIKVGRFQDTLPDVLNELKKIDYVLIDGHHEEHATIGYLVQIYPYLAKNSILVFDDIFWSKGMRNAWKKIISDTRVNAYVDMYDVGICICKL
ncbi:MAG: class I SAM-dependent methyltransferase [Cytophagales bacterium]|nr:class I SAM-dependent methyltransferase [Cytophagales bacterium]